MSILILIVPISVHGARLPVAEEGPPSSSAEALPPLYSISSLPQVHVGSLQVQVGEQNFITGSFSAYNSENATVVDLQYELLLLGPLPELQPDVLHADYDDAPAYDRVIVETPFLLAPKETKHIPISYQAPLLPEGEYRLRVQLRTSNDRELGWKDTGVRLGGSQSFIIVEPESVSVRATDPISRESRDDWLPREGPNVEPNQLFVINATLTHKGTQPITAEPVISVERMLSTRKQINQVSGDPVTLQAGERQQFFIPVTAQDTPGAYRILLTFEDGGRTVSGVAEYRYVVKGVSASIVGQRIEAFSTRAGDSAKIQFSLEGSADRQTLQQVIVEIALLDDQSVVGVAQTTVDFADPISSIDGTAEVGLERDICTQPRIRITAASPDGMTLDTYEANVDVQPVCDVEEKESEQLRWIVIGAIIVELCIIFLFVALIVRQRWKS